MKKLFGIFFVILVFGLSANFAYASVERVGQETWSFEGEYSLMLSLGGSDLEHHLVVDTYNDETGEFTAHGWFVVDTDYTWDATGMIEDDDVYMTLIYTGLNPGYQVEFEGMIAEDGMVSGQAISSTDQEITWMFEEPLTKEVTFSGNHGSWVRMHLTGEDKKFAARSRIGMPIHSMGHMK